MITESKKLKTGTPVWKEYSTPNVPVHHLSRDIKTDILIIGCGISGAMMAESLSERGLKVVLVDKREPISGSTAATTALIQYELDVPLIHLTNKIGNQDAVAAWRRSKLGLESLGAKIQHLNIECNYERRNSLYLNGNLLNPKELKKECDERNKIGLGGNILTGKELFDQYGIKAKSAIISYNNIACNPVRLTAGFLNSAVKNGAIIYSPVEIQKLKNNQNHTIATTAEKINIMATHVIFATGYEIPKYINSKKHKIHSTWVLSTKPIKNAMVKQFPFIWQASDPYLYMRTTSEGRIICGGEDEEFTDTEKRDSILIPKTSSIEKKLRKLLPEFEFEIEHRWTGSFGGSTTGLPSMGEIPRMKNVYAVMAYGGNGITFSRIAAELITSKILKNRDPEEQLFAFKKLRKWF